MICRLSILFIAVLLGGCKAAELETGRAVPRDPVPTAAAAGSALQAAVSPSSDWVRRTLSAGWRDVPPYSLLLPPELERVNVQGIDSDVAWLSAPGIDLHFDYGMYGGIGSCGKGWTCTAGETTIAGKAARTLAGERAQPDERGFRSFYSLEIVVKPLASGPFGIDLNAHAQCATPAHCERAAAALRTIEFRSAGPVMPKTKAPPMPPNGGTAAAEPAGSAASAPSRPGVR